jgi:membrane protease YdiL (CAAX protease family)
MLQKFRELCYKYAVVSSIAIAVLFYVCLNGFAYLFSLLPNNTVVGYIETIFDILYPIGIVFLFGFIGVFKERGFFKGLFCALPFIILQVISLASFFSDALSDPESIWKPWYLILLGVLMMISIGVSEECFFRATIQNILAKKYANSVKGIWFTAIVSALIFGLLHATNVFTGVDLKSACIQAFNNVFIGLFFAAIYLRSRNIWALIAIHALTDLSALAGYVFLNETTTEIMSKISWGSFLIGGLMLALSIFLLRASKCKEILARIDSETSVDMQNV